MLNLLTRVKYLLMCTICILVEFCMRSIRYTVRLVMCSKAKAKEKERANFLYCMSSIVVSDERFLGRLL